MTVAIDVETVGDGTLLRVRCDAGLAGAPGDEEDPTLVSMRERADVAGG